VKWPSIRCIVFLYDDGLALYRLLTLLLPNVLGCGRKYELCLFIFNPFLQTSKVYTCPYGISFHNRDSTTCANLCGTGQDGKESNYGDEEIIKSQLIMNFMILNPFKTSNWPHRWRQTVSHLSGFNVDLELT
jgi:hypothetical protein